MGGTGFTRRWASIALAAGVVAYVSPFALTGRVPYGQDFFGQFGPQARNLRNEVLERGELPLWNEAHYAGTPRAGDLQQGLVSPTALLYLLLPPPQAMKLYVIAYVALAAIGMYRLTRSYRLTRGACAAAALAYALSFQFTTRLVSGHVTVLAVYAFAPLVLYRLRRTLRSPTATNAVALAWVGALSALDGHPQFVYQLALLAGALAVAEIFWRAGAARRGAVLGVAAVLAAALTAHRWLPAIQVAAWDASRTAGSPAFGRDVSLGHSFLVENWSGFLLPWISRSERFGMIQARDFWNEKAVYAGWLPLVAASFALACARRPGVRFFGAAGTVAVIGAMARDFPLHLAAAHVVPVYGRFLLPCRVVWLAVPAVCVLAAFGLDSWLRGSVPQRTRTRFLVIVAAASVLFLIGALVIGLIREAAGIAALVVLSLTGLGIASRRPGLAAVLMVLLVAGDLCIQARRIARGVSAESYDRRPWYLPYLQPSPGEFRVLDLTWHDLSATAHGVRLLRGFSYPCPRSTRELVAEVCDPVLGPRLADRRPLDATLLDDLNVGWIVTEGPPPDPGSVECARHGSAVLYRRPHAHGRFFADSAPVEARRISRGWEAVIETDKPGTLVFSESWMPAWSVERNGSPVEIERHCGGLMKVEVPRGRSLVRWIYRPASFFLGLWAALAGCGLSVALLFVGRRKASPILVEIAPG